MKAVAHSLVPIFIVTELPGAPDGEDVVIQFTTSFEKKKSAIETVRPMKPQEADGGFPATRSGSRPGESGRSGGGKGKVLPELEILRRRIACGYADLLPV